MGSTPGPLVCLPEGRVMKRSSARVVIALLSWCLLAACGSPQTEASVQPLRSPRTLEAPRATNAVPAPPQSTTVVAERQDAPVELPVRSARFDATVQSNAEPDPVPVQLQIDRIGVDASIVPVGVAANGEFEVPGGTEVGWYEFGPRPGASQGSAVLAAHVDFNGRRGVFFKLRTLAPGDQIRVVFDDLSVSAFEIVSLEQYAKNALPFERVFARSGAPILTLITCGGDFDSSARSYDDNVVVTAVPVESRMSGSS